MDELAFFLSFFLTISPFAFEATLIRRQIKLISTPGMVPAQLQDFLSTNEFLRLQMFQTNAEYFHFYETVFLKIFVISLEMCLGLVPCIWNVAKLIIDGPDKKCHHTIPQSLIFIIIIFHYEFLKYTLCVILKDFIVTQCMEERKKLRIRLAWTLLCKYLIGLAVVVIVGFAIVLAVVYAEKFYYIWFWLYYCLCQWVYELYVWPFCILPLMYSMKPMSISILREHIQTQFVHFKFPHYEIMVGKRRSWVDSNNVIHFANACCRKRIVIEKMCLTPTYSTSLSDNDTINLVHQRSFSVSELTDRRMPRGTITSRASTYSYRRTIEQYEDDSSVEEDVEEMEMELELELEVETEANHSSEEEFSTGLHSVQSEEFDIVEFKYTPELIHDPVRTLSIDNIMAVVLHGFAAWKQNQWIMRILTMNVVIILWFPILALIVKLHCVYISFGFPSGSTPTFAGVLIVLLYLYRPVYMVNRYICNALKRYHVFAADKSVMKLDSATSLAEALIKIYLTHAHFPLYDSWYMAYYLSEPTLLQRLERLYAIREANRLRIHVSNI